MSGQQSAPAGPASSTEDCVECMVFGKGVCLDEFKAFDACFEAAQKNNQDEKVCMDKFDAFRSCYAAKSRLANNLTAAFNR